MICLYLTYHFHISFHWYMHSRFLTWDKPELYLRFIKGVIYLNYVIYFRNILFQNTNINIKISWQTDTYILLCTYGDIWINVHVLTMLYLMIYLTCTEGFQMDHVILDLECIQNKFKWMCKVNNTETAYNFVILNHNWYSNVSNTNGTL